MFQYEYVLGIMEIANTLFYFLLWIFVISYFFLIPRPLGPDFHFKE